MTRTIVAAFVLATVAGCGQNASHTADKSTAAPADATASAPSGTPRAVSLDAINACAFAPQEVSAVLGGSYGAGRPAESTPGAPRRDCTYDAQNGGMGQLRVNVTWLEPASAATSRVMMLNLLAGGTAPIAGDPDGAIFQDQTGLGTYALHYSRDNLLYEVRLMTFRGGAAAAREKLLSLRRL